MTEPIDCGEIDHEALAGEEQPDAWDDPTQTDWPDEDVEVDD